MPLALAFTRSISSCDPGQSSCNEDAEGEHGEGDAVKASQAAYAGTSIAAEGLDGRAELD